MPPLQAQQTRVSQAKICEMARGSWKGYERLISTKHHGFRICNNYLTAQVWQLWQPLTNLARSLRTWHWNYLASPPVVSTGYLFETFLLFFQSGSPW